MRQAYSLSAPHLPPGFRRAQKLRVVLKRAQYFITCNGKMAAGIRFREESVRRTLTMLEAKELPGEAGEQLSLFPAETERKLAP